MSDDLATVSDVRIERIAVGGDGVGHLPDGRVVFVRGAVPGDQVAVRLIDDRPRFARGEVATLVEPSAHRLESHCPGVDAGCGGCSVATVDSSQLMAWKVELVAETIRRLGRIDPPTVRLLDPLPLDGFRTTARLVADADGRPSFRELRGHELVPFDICPVLDPMLMAVIDSIAWPPGVEATVRFGRASSSATVFVHNDVPSGMDRRVRRSALGRTGDAASVSAALWHPDATDIVVEELVGGRRWRVSAPSFFQTRPDGANALVDEVRTAVARLRSRGAGDRTLLDACAGVGVLGGCVEANELIAVERSAVSCADARLNLADRKAEVIESDIATWSPVPVDIAVADPSRAGLGRRAVENIVAARPDGVVLVSCDIASMARDAGLFHEAGYRLDDVAALDMFPHTAHVELISTFVADSLEDS